ncbi:MAG: hypothetical protein CL746_06620 [Chloroflexi bacterium]|nr:hypothetical protein [Chloroflexota bacterium]
MKQHSFPIVSLITDTSVYQNKEKMVDNIAQAINIGINMVQIREKKLLNEEKKKLIKKIIVKTNNKPIIIINDEYELCKEFNIDGIHIPEKKVEQIKNLKSKLNNDQIIGCSIHSLESAILAEKLGADYLQFGSIFKTKSHPGQEPLGLKELKKITENINLPVIAVGGINEKNCLLPLQKGAYGIASIRSFSKQITSKKIIDKLNNGEIN